MINNSEIVGRVALGMGLRTSVAEGAVAPVLAAIGEALAKYEDVRIAVFGEFEQGAVQLVRVKTYRPAQCGDTGVEDAVVQG